MNVPDYISPIVGYRIWRWDGTRLVSLNGEPWPAGQALKADCKAHFANMPSRRSGSQEPHQAPQIGCSCGVYATKNSEPLSWAGLQRSTIYGEVHLWGTIVEHRDGWRAQFAYPKSLMLLPYMIPLDMKDLKSVLHNFTAYGADLSLANGMPKEETAIQLWSKSSGYQNGGLEALCAVVNRPIDTFLRVAVFADNEVRVKFLHDKLRSARIAQVVRCQVGFPQSAIDSIFEHLVQQSAEVVLIDVAPQNLEEAITTIRVSRGALSNVAVLAIVDLHDPSAFMEIVRAGADEYIDRKSPQDIASAVRWHHWMTSTYGRCTRRPARPTVWPTTPGGSSPPGGSAPPTAPVFAPLWRGPRPMRPRGVAIAL